MVMTISSMYKLPIHEHPLLFSAMFVKWKCDGCHVKGLMYGGYFCNEANCESRFHKDCAESPLEISHHPSHPEHPLLLTKMSPTENGTPCGFCGQEVLSPCYACPTCEFKVDLICGTKPSLSVIEHPLCHDHTLVFFKKRKEEEEAVSCEVCKEPIDGPSYSCIECNNVYFHLDCVHLSKEVDHSCHSSHLLKIMPSESLMDDDAQKSCHFCLKQPQKMLYHCSICTHPLTRFSSKLTFTCKVGGIRTDSYKSYICLKCDFVVSGACIGLPRVININRHDHRISFTHHFGHKGAKCGVCRKSVSQYYGAYSCSICGPYYVVHSRCAVDFTLWNGVELEGIPESSEDIVPFKVMGDNLITHFMHEKHILLLVEDYDMDVDDYHMLRCAACVCPIGFGPVYNCQECRFLLHEKCAYLPMKKNLVFDTTPYKLEYQGMAVYCKLCGLLSSGFKYTSQGLSASFPVVDVHCGSISEPLVHSGHLHPLYFLKQEEHYCDACSRDLDGYMLSCGACDFAREDMAYER